MRQPTRPKSFSSYRHMSFLESSALQLCWSMLGSAYFATYTAHLASHSHKKVIKSYALRRLKTQSFKTAVASLGKFLRFLSGNMLLEAEDALRAVLQPSIAWQSSSRATSRPPTGARPDPGVSVRRLLQWSTFPRTPCAPTFCKSCQA